MTAWLVLVILGLVVIAAGTQKHGRRISLEDVIGDTLIAAGLSVQASTSAYLVAALFAVVGGWSAHILWHRRGSR